MMYRAGRVKQVVAPVASKIALLLFSSNVKIRSTFRQGEGHGGLPFSHRGKGQECPFIETLFSSIYLAFITVDTEIQDVKCFHCLKALYLAHQTHCVEKE